MSLTINKPLQFFVLMLSVFFLLALMPQQADARKGNRKERHKQVLHQVVNSEYIFNETEVYN